MFEGELVNIYLFVLSEGGAALDFLWSGELASEFTINNGVRPYSPLSFPGLQSSQHTPTSHSDGWHPKPLCDPLVQFCLVPLPGGEQREPDCHLFLCHLFLQMTGLLFFICKLVVGVQIRKWVIVK